MRVLIVFLFAHFAFAQEFRSPAAFTNADCAAFLSSPEAQVKVADAIAWLEDLHPRTLSVMQWSSDPERPSPEIMNPRSVFFDDASRGATTEAVLERFRSARREADRLIQAPASTVIVDDLSPVPPLDADHLAALGFRTDEVVSSLALSARVRVDAGALAFEVGDDRGSRGQFRLPLHTLIHGYENAVATWQAVTLDDHRTPPARDFTEAERAEMMRLFFGAHGTFLLVRRAGGADFAYVFDKRLLKVGSSGFQLTIFRVDKCDYATMMRRSALVTARRADGKYSCYLPLGLRFIVPPEMNDPALNVITRQAY